MEFTDKELKALRTEYAANATDAQFDFWIDTCKRRNLVPVEDIVLQVRSVREYDEDTKTKIYKSKVIFITTIRALLKLAERTKKYKGFVPTEYIYLDGAGLPTQVSEIPLPDPHNLDKPLTPWAAKVGVKREGFDEPQFAVARFHAYAQSYKNSDGNKVLNDTWKTRGPEQLAKCGKAAILREAFPEELGGLYLHEEFQDDDEAPKSAASKTATEPVAPTVAPPATVAPPVDQKPAEGKVAPRPGEAKAANVEAPATPTPTVPVTASEAVKEPVQKPATKRGSKKTTAAAAEVKTLEAPATEPATKAPESPEGLTSKVDILDANRLPTKAEFSEILTKLVKFRDRVGGAGSEGSQQLRSFILTKSKRTDTKELFVQEWLDIFAILSKAVDDADLKGIVAKS